MKTEEQRFKLSRKLHEELDKKYPTEKILFYVTDKEIQRVAIDNLQLILTVEEIEEIQELLLTEGFLTNSILEALSRWRDEKASLGSHDEPTNTLKHTRR